MCTAQKDPQMNASPELNNHEAVLLSFPGRTEAIPSTQEDQGLSTRDSTESPAKHADQTLSLEDVAMTAPLASVLPAVPVVPGSPSAADPSSARGAQSTFPAGYASFDDGIYQLPEDGGEPIFVCSPLRVIAMFSDASGSGWGRLVSVRDDDGRWHDLQVLNADLSRKSAEVVARLLDHGLTLGHVKDAKDRVLRLLKLWKPDERLTTISQLGWADETFSSFALGDTVIGQASVLSHVSLTRGPARHLIAKGTAQTWRDNIGRKCNGNPLMIVAVSLAFSGPLLALLGEPGGGLHFRGTSSSGKTTLLRLAASVWGARGLIGQWRATSNGLEGTASAMNDMLLPLDEIAEISPRALHEAIYMLANGKAKSRMTKDVMLSDTATWRVAIISSGEISVEEKLKEASLGMMAGHEVRLIDVEADARAWGVFDNLHGATTAAAFADDIRQSTDLHHGAVGREFVLRLSKMVAGRGAGILDVTARALATGWVTALPTAADGPILRVARRFAVIALAGVLACQMGLTGITKEEVIEAVKSVFFDWYDRRFGAEREAADGAVIKLKTFLDDQSAALQEITAPTTSGVQTKGWRDTTRAYLPADTWSSIFPGVEGTKAAKALLDLHLIVPGENGRIMRKAPHAIAGRPRLYTVNLDRVAAYRTE